MLILANTRLSSHQRETKKSQFPSSVFAFIVPIQCDRYQSDLLVKHTQTDTHTHTHIHTRARTLPQMMNTVPFPVFSGMWYSTCRGSSRRSAWSSFCINHFDCCCLTARLTACNSTGASGYGGLRTAITAREPTSPVHPLHAALYPQPACASSCVL